MYYIRMLFMAYNYMKKLNTQKNSVASYYLDDFLGKKLHINLGKTLLISEYLCISMTEKNIKTFDLFTLVLYNLDNRVSRENCNEKKQIL